jgi:hypothetical protein
VKTTRKAIQFNFQSKTLIFKLNKMHFLMSVGYSHNWLRFYEKYIHSVIIEELDVLTTFDNNENLQKLKCVMDNF